MATEEQKEISRGDSASAPVPVAQEPSGPASPARTAGTSVTVLVGLVLAIATSAFALYRTYTSAPAAPPVYTVNLDALVQAKQIQSNSITDVKAYGAAMQTFMNDVRSTFDGLSNRGVIVLKSDSVLTSVSSVDITVRMAEKLGLTTALAQVPAHEAQRRAQYQAQLKKQLSQGAASDANTTGAAVGGSSTGAAGAASAASDPSGLSKLD